ncbi:exported hypothetical protein [Clostridium neonatale]|uniref:Uncharacterized protein n=1 Tax=Clostridium neonatale TaxID=137838 RepID=A0AA86JLP5_9CLOT|nr:exported hypothetical protein [Clostridium neonatale]CAI3569035.1 exported hypothetical protein [Clostridium neonatale]CAI3576881.1 exported hypothetical protein [Clostridium neonatale]CAI3583744.1 exported hypothetical protein [Clostridium neonatale]CAI3591466.1 exported hypothetical protein [Clostridium neonatale]
MLRLPRSAACRHTCGTPHKAAVPVPGVSPLPEPYTISVTIDISKCRHKTNCERN